MSTLILSNHVQVYKASLNDAQTNSLPSSFSSGTSSSPTFDLSPVSASQTSLLMMAMPNPFIYGGQDSRPRSTGCESSFQLSADFHPEWLGKGEMSQERPAKWTSINSTNASQADLSLAEWWTEPLEDTSHNPTGANASNPNMPSDGFLSKSTNS